MEIKAQLNYLRISPRKVRLVASLIKGMDVKRAELELRILLNRSAPVILKLLKSSIANAAKNFQLEPKGLYIKKMMVNEGPVLKRFRPRAFGRSSPIRKRTSHILMVLGTSAPAPLSVIPKRESPVIREASAEDIIMENRTFKGASPKKEPLKLKSKGFIRRIFQRKVI